MAIRTAGEVAAEAEMLGGIRPGTEAGGEICIAATQTEAGQAFEQLLQVVPRS